METALNSTEAPAPEHLPEPLAPEGVHERLPSLHSAPGSIEEPAADTSSSGSSALVRVRTRSSPAKQEPLSSQLPVHVQQIQFRLQLCVPIPGFTLRRLQNLTADAVLVTEHSSSRDLVLTAAGERLLLVELEAVELQLAARVKRLL